MAFITDPTNVDYLIDDVRLHIGDLEGTTYSNSVIRSALLGGIRYLQRKWKNRYLVFQDAFIVNPVPDDVTVASGYWYVALPEGYATLASGYVQNDVFRNPYYTFSDPGGNVISQEDEYPIILAAAIILRKSSLTSSAVSFQTWSDGEYSFSNVSSARALQSLFDNDLAALDALFSRRLQGALRSDLPRNC